MSSFSHVSTKEHYALRMMVWLAKTYHNRDALSLGKISRSEKISLKYLEHLIRPFVMAGWVRSCRGRDGGYIMIKDPQQVNLHEMMQILYGRLELVECLDAARQIRCAQEPHCVSKRAWGRVQKAMEQTLRGITLGELVE